MSDDYLQFLSHRLSSVYRERNLVALAFATVLYITGSEAGWYRDDTDKHNWPVVWVDLKNGDETQMGWHVHPDMIPLLDESVIPRAQCVYDGHSRTDRNNRIMKIIEAGMNATRKGDSE